MRREQDHGAERRDSKPEATPSSPSVRMLVLFWGVLFGLYLMVCWGTSGIAPQRFLAFWLPFALPIWALLGVPLMLALIVTLRMQLSGEPVTWSVMGTVFLRSSLYGLLLLVIVPMLISFGILAFLFSIFQPGISV